MGSYLESTQQIDKEVGQQGLSGLCLKQGPQQKKKL